MPSTRPLPEDEPREPKRRRIASPSSATEGPTPPSASSIITPDSLVEKEKEKEKEAQSFHLKVQENVFAGLMERSAAQERLEKEIVLCITKADELRTQQKDHADVMNESLNAINTTLELAASLSHVTRRLSSEAMNISEQVRQFMIRYTSFTSPLIRAGITSYLGELRPKVLDMPAKDLWKSHLFEGLFDDVEFDFTRDYDQDWDAIVKKIGSSNSNSHQIATSWTSIFETFSAHTNRQLYQFPASFIKATSYFREEVGKIIKVVAILQLEKMSRIDDQLADLMTRANRMRATNLENWRVFKSLEAKINNVEARLFRAEKDLIPVRERYLEDLLQMIVLSKGP